jgi:hypothetical protein
MSYIYKDRIVLVFEANKKRLRAEGQIILATLLNEALGEMSRQFDAAQARGELLEIGGSREEMKQFLRVAAQRELGDGSVK